MERFSPLFVVLAASLWAVDGIVLRPELYSLPVALVVFVETSIVALLLTPVFGRQWKNIRALKGKDWLAFLGVAVFGGVLGTMAITKALFYVDFVNLSIVVLIQKLQPVFAIILASFLLKERPPLEFFFWAALAVLGAYGMTFGFNLPNLDTGDKTAAAAGYALLAAFSFGASTVFSKRALRRVNFGLATYLRFLLTAIMMGVIVAATSKISLISGITAGQMVIFLFIALITGGPAIFLYYYGLKRITASIATICELAFPLTAVFLEYLLHDKILNPVQWLGVVLLFASILRVTRIRLREA